MNANRAAEFAGSQVQRIAFPFDTLRFYREFVSQNRPCIITGATESWQASDNWTASYLLDKLGNTKVRQTKPFVAAALVSCRL